MFYYTKITFLPDHNTQYACKVGKKNSSLPNKHCIIQHVEGMEQHLEKLLPIVFIHKAGANPRIPSHRYKLILLLNTIHI